MSATNVTTILISINGTPWKTTTASGRARLTLAAKALAASVNGRVQRTISTFENSMQAILVDVQTDGYANYTASDAVDNWLDLQNRRGQDERLLISA